MKTNIAKITATSLALLLALLMQTNPVNAQQTWHKSGKQNSQPGAKHEKMEAQHVAFITQKLALTPEEAQAFWPVYNEYDAKRDELRKSFRESGGLNKAENETLTEAQASKVLDDQIIEAQKFLDLRKEYHAKFKSVLPAVKVLKLYDAERDFQKMLMDKMRQHKSNPPMDKK
ncbi:MAG: hypothetical protein WC780_17575 [Lentimicrobiaceae bacterium]|jgi:hypothetical protein